MVRAKPKSLLVLQAEEDVETKYAWMEGARKKYAEGLTRKEELDDLVRKGDRAKYEQDGMTNKLYGLKKTFEEAEARYLRAASEWWLISKENV